MEKYLKNGLSVIPLNADKTPLGRWKQYQSEYIQPFTSQYVGIITGKISGNLEAIDIDTKNDKTGKLWDDYKESILDYNPLLFNALVIQRTISGGYHLVYRCDEIGRNIKLATAENNEVLIETRGEGGYICASPFPNYTLIHNDFTKIPKISVESRRALFFLAKQFNKVESLEYKEFKPSAKNTINTGLKSWDVFNTEHTCENILRRNGWTIGTPKGNITPIYRPNLDKVGNKYSGVIFNDNDITFIFSTSQNLPTEKGLNAFAIFTYLEHNGDFKKSARVALINQSKTNR